MIQCTVCLAENDEFATTCVSCKAFLQNRIPNLDLFDIGWKVIESPRSAFRSIAVAEHKNYALFLFTLFGISLSFTLFWYLRLGTRFMSLIDLIPAAVGAGIVLGLVGAFVLSGVYHLLARLFGGAAGYRTSLGLLGYSMTPIALSLFLVLPIELLTFGMYLFTSNPHPYTMKPTSYLLLVGFDGALALWSISLAVVGTRVGHRISLFKSFVAVLGTFGLFLAALFLIAQQFHLTDLV